MTENTCRFGDQREELLLGYLYEELEPAAREAFGAHLERCGICRTELDGFRGVRAHLASWTPPAFNRELSAVAQPSLVAPRLSSGDSQRWWQAVPAWAQVAAALLFLGLGAALANLNIHYDASGLTVRTGWMTAAAGAPAGAAPARVSLAKDAAPWRSDLTAMERQLRTEFHAAAVAQPGRAPETIAHAANRSVDAETLRRIRAMLDESERKQQRELALRVAEVMHDVDNQRRADLTRISQSLGQLQSNTGMEVMKQRQLLNYLVSVSQKP